jgi:hypothetical protein
MKIRDLIVEQTPSTTAPVPGVAVDPNASSDDKLQQLTQALSDMRDKVTTLQKNALTQASAAPVTPAAAAVPAPPGTTTQPNIAKGTVGSTTQPTTAATTPAPGQKPGLGAPNGVPMGQTPPAGAPTIAPAKPALGVSQPPQQLQAKMRADLLQQMNK